MDDGRPGDSCGPEEEGRPGDDGRPDDGYEPRREVNRATMADRLRVVITAVVLEGVVVETTTADASAVDIQSHFPFLCLCWLR